MAIEVAAPVRIAEAPSSHSDGFRRVLMTADTVGGVWQYALELCRGLGARGHEVVLATMGPPPSREQRREAKAIDGLVVHSRACRLVWMDDPWTDVQAAGDWLLGVAAREQPDVIHLNDFGHGALPWPAPVLLVGHSCVASWWQAVHGSALPQQWQRYRAVVAAALEAARLVVAPSRAMAQALQTHYALSRRVRVIPNGRGSGAPAAPKGRWIFCAGRVDDAAKNMAALAAVAARVPWQICIAGATHRPDGMPRFGPNVRLLGRLGGDQLRLWLAHAPIYALPARYEPFGLSVLEAAQARCALVLGDIDSLRENWDGAAAFVAPDDHRALAVTLQRLIDDPVLRERQAALAERRARNFTPGRMVAAYEQAYAEIAGARIGAGQAMDSGGIR